MPDELEMLGLLCCGVSGSVLRATWRRHFCGGVQVVCIFAQPGLSATTLTPIADEIRSLVCGCQFRQ